MKHILVMICIAVVMTATNVPPLGNCQPDEKWRCYVSRCMSTLMYCPDVWEDGVYKGSSCNTTTCEWDCSCVKKQPKEAE